MGLNRGIVQDKKVWRKAIMMNRPMLAWIIDGDGDDDDDDNDNDETRFWGLKKDLTSFFFLKLKM